jgi:WD40 repeat protein
VWARVGHWRRGRVRGGPQNQNTPRTAQVWDVSRGVRVATLTFDDVDGTAAFSPDGKHLLAPDGAGLVPWDLTAGRALAHAAHELLRAPPIFSGDGRHLAIVEDTATRVLETSGLRELLRVPLPKATFRVAAFSPSGADIAVGSDDTVTVWTLAGARTTAVLPVKYATAILFTADGKRVVTANWNFYDSSDRSVRIWEVDGLREVDRLPLLDVERAANVDASETRLALTTDGRYLAIANQGTFRIWDMVTRQEVARWEGSYATAIAFSPDEKRLLAENNTTVSVWSWDAQTTMAAACKRLSRNLDAAEWRLYLGDQPLRKTCADR